MESSFGPSGLISKPDCALREEPPCFYRLVHFRPFVDGGRWIAGLGFQAAERPLRFRFYTWTQRRKPIFDCSLASASALIGLVDLSLLLLFPILLSLPECSPEKCFPVKAINKGLSRALLVKAYP
ncbi:hypothetical protein HPB50_002251 [Hyalomma asiaticum]|uniref:Uncharacterized protein n=1 Tax=Hyalomma asiaticum TaxID=266040 RepID=A0ACB7TH75_HYAAI|nr:hypothetical protein HPB50_002251 [Hyalomma asiaticum]